MSFFTDAWDYLTNAFSPKKQIVLKAAEEGLHLLAESGGDDFLHTVARAVEEAEASGKSGPEKFQIAKKTIQNAFHDVIHTLRDNAINLAIEFAVAAINKRMRPSN